MQKIPLRTIEDVIARVEVDQVTGCWVWQGALDTKRYGRVWVAHGDGLRSNRLAHRVVWELKHGPVPKGLFVLHGCDNPSCVNPDGVHHLHVGTPKLNAEEMSLRGRQHVQKITAETALAIRREYARNWGSPATSVTYRDIELKYQISTSAVVDILHRRTFAHLPVESGTEMPYSAGQNPNSYNFRRRDES